MYHTVESSDGEYERHEEIKGMKESYQVLEKRLRAIEGEKVFGVAAKGMCLVSGLVTPVKFKTPNFDKYKGH